MAKAAMLIGAPLKGRVLIVDDVISAGTATRESLALIREHGAEPAGVLIALDRQERGAGATSAAQEITAQFGIPVDRDRAAGRTADARRRAAGVAAYRPNWMLIAPPTAARRREAILICGGNICVNRYCWPRWRWCSGESRLRQDEEITTATSGATARAIRITTTCFPRKR